MSKYEFIKFIPEEIDRIWSLVEDLIQSACDRAGGFADAEHIRQILKNARMQLWVVWDVENQKVLCVCVTELREYPKYRICDIKITVGRGMKTWFHFIDHIMEWAKKQGCKKMEVFARPGWKKILESRGFKQTHVQIEKEL